MEGFKNDGAAASSSFWGDTDDLMSFVDIEDTSLATRAATEPLPMASRAIAHPSVSRSFSQNRSTNFSRPSTLMRSQKAIGSENLEHPTQQHSTSSQSHTGAQAPHLIETSEMNQGGSNGSTTPLGEVFNFGVDSQGHKDSRLKDEVAAVNTQSPSPLLGPQTSSSALTNPKISMTTSREEAPRAEFDSKKMYLLESMLSTGLRVCEGEESSVNVSDQINNDCSGLLDKAPLKSPPGLLSVPGTHNLEHVMQDSPVDHRYCNEVDAVRVSREYWQAISKYIEDLEEQKKSAIERLGRLQRETSSKQSSKIPGSEEIEKLLYQVKAYKDYEATMGRELRDKDIKLFQREQELKDSHGLKERIQDLEFQLERSAAELDFLRKGNATLEDTRAQLVAEEVAKKVHEYDSQQTASVRAAHAVNKTNTDCKKLAEALARAQVAMKRLEDKLLEEQNKSQKLLGQMEFMQQNLPSVQVVKTLEDKLADKSSQLLHQLNEKQQVEEKYEQCVRINYKLHNGLSILRGAAYLVQAPAKTTLDKKVMPCMECHTKNIDCDHKGRCYNCTASDRTCTRWKCSMTHEMKECELLTCPLTHDVDGFLLFHTERPHW